MIKRVQRTSSLAILSLLVALAVYFSVGVADLDVPGLQYDEAADAVPAMELLTGQLVSSLSTVTIFGRQLPLMMLHHIGPTSILTSFVGMAFLGVSVQALRISQLIVGAVTLLLLWLAGRRWFGSFTASITVLLCATAPAFIWWNRAGANWTVPLLPLSLGLFLLLEHWWQSRKTVSLVGAAFLFGAGFTTKILFIWWLAPIVIVALIVIGLRQGLKELRSLQMGTIAPVALALLAGLSPFIVHNIQSPLATFKFLASNVLTTAIYGHNNLDFVNNLRQVVTEFTMMMGGDTLVFRAPSGMMLGEFAFVASVLFELAYCIKYRSLLRIGSSRTSDPPDAPRRLRLRLFLVVAVLTVIPLSTISTSTIGATYLFILAPLAWLLVGVAISDAVGLLRHTWITQNANWTGVIAVTGIVVAQVGTNVAIVQFFETTGGHALWSDAIFTLAEELESKYSSRPIIAMDWGFARSVTFLTKGRIHMREAFDFLPQPSPRFNDVSLALLQDPGNVYVFHAPEATAFQGYYELFERVVRQSHKSLHLIRAIQERSGTPNTLVCEALDAARSFEVSPTLATRNAAFSGGLTLLGGSVVYDAAKREVAVDLQWQSLTDNQSDDTVLLHIVDQSDGSVVANGDQRPVYGNYPFSDWHKTEVVIDPHWISLPADLKPGTYQVRVGVYDRSSGARRDIHDPQNDAAGNSLMLHSFEIK